MIWIYIIGCFVALALLTYLTVCYAEELTVFGLIGIIIGTSFSWLTTLCIAAVFLFECLENNLNVTIWKKKK